MHVMATASTRLQVDTFWVELLTGNKAFHFAREVALAVECNFTQDLVNKEKCLLQKIFYLLVNNPFCIF